MKKASRKNKNESKEETTVNESDKSESAEIDSSTIRNQQLLKAVLDDPKLLEAMPKEVRISMAETASFSAPLPPPSMFESYEQTLPGSADRILKIVEKEQNHRFQWTDSKLRGEISILKRGQIFGFFIAIFGLSIGAFLGYKGYTIVAALLVATGILGLIRELIEKFK